MQATMLGRCPNCGVAIPGDNKLLEYETADGWTAMFAECPDCLDVVHPR